MKLGRTTPGSAWRESRLLDGRLLATGVKRGEGQFESNEGLKKNAKVQVKVQVKI